jgi:hypothetical protein
MDVDGAERALLDGMLQLLARPTTRTLLIEVNDDTRTGVRGVLADFGFEPKREVAHGETSNIIFDRAGPGSLRLNS